MEKTGNVTSNGGRSQLGNVGRAHSRLDSDTESGEETSGVLVVERSSKGLKTTADGKDGASYQEGSLSADVVGQRSGTESTEEGLQE